jgi:hypothetical protein
LVVMFLSQICEAESTEGIRFEVGVAISCCERQGLAILNASCGGIILEGKDRSTIHCYFGTKARRLRAGEFFGFVEALFRFGELLQMVVIHSLSEISLGRNIVGLQGGNQFGLEHLKRILREAAIHQDLSPQDSKSIGPREVFSVKSAVSGIGQVAGCTEIPVAHVRPNLGVQDLRRRLLAASAGEEKHCGKEREVYVPDGG